MASLEQRLTSKSQPIFSAAWNADGKTVAFGNTSGSTNKTYPSFPLTRTFNLENLEVGQTTGSGFTRGTVDRGQDHLEIAEERTVTLKRNGKSAGNLTVPLGPGDPTIHSFCFWDKQPVVGTGVGEFGRQAYTDGGIFDNLGVRMFHCLGKAILTGKDALDGVLVSDVGKSISVRGNERAGGVIRTAMRSSDILMERVGRRHFDKLPFD